MTSYVNGKNKKGLTKLATLITEAGFKDVKITVGVSSITVTPNNESSLKVGLFDLKAGRYKFFKSVGDGRQRLESTIQESKTETVAPFFASRISLGVTGQ